MILKTNQSLKLCKIYHGLALAILILQVDGWMDFCVHTLEVSGSLWYYPCVGAAPYNEHIADRAKSDFTKGMKVLELHLKRHSMIVGIKLTLADIAIVCALLYPFKYVADEKYRRDFPHVMKWFDKCVKMPEFVEVLGDVELCVTTRVPAAS